ncbi:MULTISPECIES: hypothetical protein [unclassified Sphingomonas]|nr:hypothetical protein [Sphingomonas sp. NIBR02145]WHU02229.1 hypothetical protein O3305_18895 [Sphingomonas sp. NIBR02145]
MSKPIGRRLSGIYSIWRKTVLIAPGLTHFGGTSPDAVVRAL